MTDSKTQNSHQRRVVSDHQLHHHRDDQRDGPLPRDARPDDARRGHGALGFALNQKQLDAAGPLTGTVML